MGITIRHGKKSNLESHQKWSLNFEGLEGTRPPEVPQSTGPTPLPPQGYDTLDLETKPWKILGSVQAQQDIFYWCKENR